MILTFCFFISIYDGVLSSSSWLLQPKEDSTPESSHWTPFDFPWDRPRRLSGHCDREWRGTSEDLIERRLISIESSWMNLLKLIHIDGVPIIVLLQLCDIRGRERNLTNNTAMWRSFFMTRRTLSRSRALRHERPTLIRMFLVRTDSRPIPCVMVGAKADLPCMFKNTKIELLQFLKEARYSAHFNVSSKTGFGVTDSIEFVAASQVRTL